VTAGPAPEEPSDPPFDAFTHIWEAPAHWAERTPDAVALSAGDETLGYAALDARVAALARALEHRGVVHGDRVMVLGENGPAMAVAILAVTRTGAWVVPFNARSTRREVDTVRAHARPRLSLYATDTAPAAAEHAEADGAGVPTDLQRFGLACAAHAAGPPEPAAADPADDIAALLYTTGTTGAPKAVMLSHRNLLFVAGRSTWMRRLSQADRVYGVLPISHVFGLASVFLGTLYRGARLELAARFGAEAAARDLVERRITVFQGVSVMFGRLVELQRLGQLEPARTALRYISSGGAPLDVGLKREVQRLFGLNLHNGYGQTETSPSVTMTEIDRPRDDDSSGVPLPGVALAIVDPDTGRALSTDEVGEICVHGDLVMRGYYKAPEATAAALSADGWLRTGDLGRITADGHLFVVGRLKELIIRSGFNVHPPEVEAILTGHPDVALAAVIGRRDQQGNEQVVAYVQPVTGRTLDVDALRAHAAERLAPYKRPAWYEVREVLPATATGKILKHKLDG
jgi:acyl-CoA synthetase (AMP-forming)/AMP-acid ligase II